MGDILIPGAGPAPMQGGPVPMLPSKVKEQIEARIADGFELQEALGKAIENEEDETQKLILHTLKWLLDNQLPIKV